MPKDEKRPKRPSESRRYDVEMIRDFLDHLLWELRIAVHESQSTDRTKTNPELVDQLQKYQKKRQTMGLLFATAVEEKPTLPEKAAQLRKLLGEFRKSQLLRLEALLSLFSEAFENAEQATTFNIDPFDTFDEAIDSLKKRMIEHETGESG
jgi:hypothetical protein